MAIDPDKLLVPPLPLDSALLEEFARMKDPFGTSALETYLDPNDRAEYVEQRHKATKLEQEWRVRRLAAQKQPSNENQDACTRAAEERDAQIDRCLIPLYRSFHKAKRSALCLSGGGIRSATFGLGVLQRLAEINLLTSFDYLSTVSGGGYIGSWLSCLLQRLGDDARSALLPERDNKIEPESVAVRHLRDYSNYLHPEAGLLTADTWTLASTFFRNLGLNWLILVPALATLLLLPRLFQALVKLGERHELLGYIAFACGTVCATITIWYTATQLPGARAKLREDNLKRPQGKKVKLAPNYGQIQFVRWWLVPLGLAAMFTALCWSWLPLDSIWRSWPVWVGWGTAFHLAGWVLARTWKPLVLAGTVATGLVGGSLTWIAFTWLSSINDDDLYAVIAMPLLLGLYGLLGIVFTGLATKWMSDEDREWWARSGAWNLIAVFGWMVLAVVTIFGPKLLLALPGGAKSAIAAAGGISGIFTILLGRSPKTKAGHKGNNTATETNWSHLALSLAAPVFCVLLLAGIALGDDLLIAAASRIPIVLPRGTQLARVGSLTVIAGLIAYLSARLINVNKYSLHAMYRDRLIRAYLGASRKESDRHPNRFTGFDPDDNISIFQLRTNKPTHIVNMSLNLVRGARLAWQQRKAESYTASPWHVGSLRLGYRTTYVSHGRAEELLMHPSDGTTLKIPSDIAEENLSLGTAVAISGAAANPNMGYQSSPVVTFLMTMFNARLGWWLGNPGEAGARTWYKAGPRNALKPLLSELFGLTDDESEYVNISDGGHFENLALYEMILRRVHFIVVSDSGCDATYCFEDLANAIRKINIDFGIPIEFPDGFPIKAWAQVQAEPVLTQDARHYAIGRIRYSVVDEGAEDGWLLYIKPVLTGDEPRDLLQYVTVDARFPHQPTLTDQSYDEAQFESYRKLGYHSAWSIGHPLDGSVASLFNAARGASRAAGA